MTKPIDYEDVRKRSLQFYLFGTHIKHSKAPLLHNTLYRELGLNWNYSILETTDHRVLDQYVRSGNQIGCAVTMPNKVKFVEYIDKLDEIGTVVGSINTVYTTMDESGTKLLVGTNTDTVGITESFLQDTEAKTIVEAAKGKPGLVYGAGGASRAALYALYTLLDCRDIYIVNRDASEVKSVQESMKKQGLKANIIHVSSPSEARELPAPQVAVLTVPDFPASTKEELVAKEVLDVFRTATKGAVLEMCYHPKLRTRLYEEFEKSGWRVINGAIAMIYQGLAQVSLWSGYSLDELPIEEIIQLIENSLELK